MALTLPHSLANLTVADATKVMQNLYAFYRLLNVTKLDASYLLAKYYRFCLSGTDMFAAIANTTVDYLWYTELEKSFSIRSWTVRGIVGTGTVTFALKKYTGSSWVTIDTLSITPGAPSAYNSSLTTSVAATDKLRIDQTSGTYTGWTQYAFSIWCREELQEA